MYLCFRSNFGSRGVGPNGQKAGANVVAASLEKLKMESADESRMSAALQVCHRMFINYCKETPRYTDLCRFGRASSDAMALQMETYRSGSRSYKAVAERTRKTTRMLEYFSVVGWKIEALTEWQSAQYVLHRQRHGGESGARAAIAVLKWLYLITAAETFHTGPFLGAEFRGWTKL